MTHQLRFAARSDRGLLRSNNQDSVYAGDRLLIVADGMGGHAAGDLASRVVVAAFAPLDAHDPGEDLERPLTLALLEGNDAIAELVAEDPELDGMGTTATALLFDGDRVGMAHIGDSRAYLYRNGVMNQLTHDDTFVQSLVDDARITEDEAAHHPQRNLLLRALNGTEPEPTISVRDISVGDRFLICSDGLSSVVGAEAIADALAEPDPDAAADQLIELALVAGGPDNVTVIVADVADIGARSTAVPSGPYDPDATGPIKPIHVTQRMPRVPLPAIDDDPVRRGIAPEASRTDGHDDGADRAGSAGSDDGDFDSEIFDEDIDPDELAAAEAARRRRLWRRWSAVGVAVLVLLGVATAGTFLWARSHYFVGGDSDGRVVVYRGVNGSVLGLSLNSVQEDSCAGAAGCDPIRVDDLVDASREQVLAGIPVTDLAQARDVVARLHDRRLPPCDTESGSSGSSSSAATSTSAASSSDPTGSGTASSDTASSDTASSDTAGSSTAGSSASSSSVPTTRTAAAPPKSTGTSATTSKATTSPSSSKAPRKTRARANNRLHAGGALQPAANGSGTDRPLAGAPVADDFGAGEPIPKPQCREVR